MSQSAAWQRRPTLLDIAQTVSNCQFIDKCGFRNRTPQHMAASIKQVKNNAKLSEEIHQFSGVGDATLRDVMMVLLGITYYNDDEPKYSQEYLKIVQALEGIYWDYNDTGGMIKTSFVADLDEYVSENGIDGGIKNDEEIKEERRRDILQNREIEFENYR